MSEQPEKRDPYDGDYVGNIWGWRISLIGAAVIVLLSAFAAYRHYTLDVPFGMEDPEQVEEQSATDSTNTANPDQE